jgi:hypothetical protein
MRLFLLVLHFHSAKKIERGPSPSSKHPPLKEQPAKGVSYYVSLGPGRSNEQLGKKINVFRHEEFYQEF